MSWHRPPENRLTSNKDTPAQAGISLAEKDRFAAQTTQKKRRPPGIANPPANCYPTLYRDGLPPAAQSFRQSTLYQRGGKQGL